MCKLNTNVKKFLEIKSQIEALKAEADKLSTKIVSQMGEENLKSVEVNDVKVTVVNSTKVSYDESVVALLEVKAPEAIVKSFDKSKLEACIKVGKLSEADVKVYKKESKSTYLKVTK